MTRRLVRYAGVALALMLLSGCGYTFSGRGNTLPAHIRTIGVPQCVNHSSTPDIDGVLTDKVRQEFQNRGRYVVNPSVDGADATLSCVVNSVTIMPLEFGADRLPTRYALVVSASIEFKDVSTDKVLYSNPGLQSRDEFSVTTGQSITDANAFLRTDTQASQRLALSFARTIVTSILEAF